MFSLPRIADIDRWFRNVRFVQIADIAVWFEMKEATNRGGLTKHDPRQRQTKREGNRALTLSSSLAGQFAQQVFRYSLRGMTAGLRRLASVQCSDVYPAIDELE